MALCESTPLPGHASSGDLKLASDLSSVSHPGKGLEPRPPDHQLKSLLAHSPAAGPRKSSPEGGKGF